MSMSRVLWVLFTTDEHATRRQIVSLQFVIFRHMLDVTGMT